MKLIEARQKLAEHYAAHAKPTTIKKRDYWLKRTFEQMHIYHLEDLTQDKLKNWMLNNSSRMEGSSMHEIINQCMIFLRFCVQQKYLPAMPIESRALPKLIIKEAEKPPFTQEQHEAILRACDKQPRDFWRPACIIAWNTAMRFSDVACLNWLGVDFKHNLIRYQPIKLARYGRPLVIPMEPELLTCIQALHTKRYCEWVLPDLYGRFLLDTRITRRWFREILNEAAIAPGYSFHSYRHGFVTRLINAGVDHLTIASMSGHTTDQIARYAHISDETKRRALKLARSPDYPPPIKLLEVA